MKKASNLSKELEKPSKPALRLLERHIQEQCVGFMKYRNWLAYRNNPLLATIVGTQTVVGSCEPGTFDYRFAYPLVTDWRRPTGLCLNVWVEFKLPGEKLSPKQVKFKLEHERRGELCWVVDSFELHQQLYFQYFGWLHSGQHARGQQSMFDCLPDVLRPGA